MDKVKDMLKSLQENASKLFGSKDVKAMKDDLMRGNIPGTEELKEAFTSGDYGGALESAQQFLGDAGTILTENFGDISDLQKAVADVASKLDLDMPELSLGELEKQVRSIDVGDPEKWKTDVLQAFKDNDINVSVLEGLDPSELMKTVSDGFALEDLKENILASLGDEDLVATLKSRDVDGVVDKLKELAASGTFPDISIDQLPNLTEALTKLPKVAKSILSDNDIDVSKGLDAIPSTMERGIGVMSDDQIADKFDDIDYMLGDVRRTARAPHTRRHPLTTTPPHPSQWDIENVKWGRKLAKDCDAKFGENGKMCARRISGAKDAGISCLKNMAPNAQQCIQGFCGGKSSERGLPEVNAKSRGEIDLSAMMKDAAGAATDAVTTATDVVTDAAKDATTAADGAVAAAADAVSSALPPATAGKPAAEAKLTIDKGLAAYVKKMREQNKKTGTFTGKA